MRFYQLARVPFYAALKVLVGCIISTNDWINIRAGRCFPISSVFKIP